MSRRRDSVGLSGRKCLLRGACVADPVTSAAYAFGWNVLLTFALTFATVAVAMMLGCRAAFWQFVAGFAMAQALAWTMTEPRAYLRSLVAVVAVWALCLWLCTNICDSNWDGNAHHQEMMVYALSDRWNFYRFAPGPEEAYLWTFTYPKGMELAGATFVDLTHNIESGKTFMTMLYVAAIVLAWGLLRGVKPEWSRRRVACVVYLLAACPLVVCSLFWLKNDTPTYIFPLLTLMFTYGIVMDRQRTASYVGLCAVILLAVAIKLNQFFYEGLFIVAILAGMLIYRRRGEFWRYLIVTASMAIISALFFCWHPYLTNWYLYGHPFYPLMGDGAVDIMTGLTPADYLARDRFTNFLYSYMLSFNRDNLLVGMTCMGHYTPILSVCTIALIGGYVWKVRRFTPMIYAWLVILASCFVFEQSWWARYVAFLWLLVPTSYFVWASSRKRIVRILRWALLTVVSVNLSITVYQTVLAQVFITIERNAMAEVLSGKTVKVAQCNRVIKYQFDHQGIEIEKLDLRYADLDTIPVERKLLYYAPKYFPTLILAPEEKVAIKRKARQHWFVRSWRRSLDTYHRILKDKPVNDWDAQDKIIDSKMPGDESKADSEDKKE